MYGALHIANLALAKVGNYTILSLDDPSEPAIMLKALYPATRDAELSAHRWGFATARAMLPALDEAPAFGYQRAFALPAGCLRVLEVGPGPLAASSADGAGPGSFPGAAGFRFGVHAAWQVEGERILSNLPAPLALVHIRREDNPERYPATFAEALACKLAIGICERLAGGRSRRESLWQEYSETLRIARRVNDIQRSPVLVQDGAWMLARIACEGGR